jgi:hypothetical protein
LCHDKPERAGPTARRAAKRIGLVAQKSRRRAGTVDNWGGYQLIDAHHNFVVDGSRFDLSAEEVIRICERDSWQQVGDAAAKVVEKMQP